MRHLGVALTCLTVLGATAAQATNLKVMCDSPLQPALPAIGEAFRKATSHHVDFVFVPSPEIRKKIADGETADIIIIQPDIVADLAERGKADQGDHPAFGRIGIGLAVRADAPGRETKTPDALKQVLLRANIIVLDNVTSGTTFAKVLGRLGIVEDVKAKVVRTSPDEVFERILRGTGDDIAVGTITLIRAEKRLKLLGALPAELQSYISYAAVPVKGTPNMKAAVEFIRFLSTRNARELLAAAGVE